MNRKQDKRLLVLAGIGALVALTYCSAMIYHGLPVEGYVIDANSKQPISDVIVVAEWPIEAGLFGTDAGFLHIAEAITDATGRYVIPGWGRKMIVHGYLDPTAPTLYFLKREYGFLRVSNEQYSIGPMDPIQSEWDKKTVEMKLFSGSAKDYAWEMDGYDEVFSPIAAPCAWADIPRFSAEIVKLSEESMKQGILTGLPLIGELHDAGSVLTDKCPDPRIVLKDYLK